MQINTKERHRQIQKRDTDKYRREIQTDPEERYRKKQQRDTDKYS